MQENPSGARTVPSFLHRQTYEPHVFSHQSSHWCPSAHSSTSTTYLTARYLFNSIMLASLHRKSQTLMNHIEWFWLRFTWVSYHCSSDHHTQWQIPLCIHTWRCQGHWCIYRYSSDYWRHIHLHLKYIKEKWKSTREKGVTELFINHNHHRPVQFLPFSLSLYPSWQLHLADPLVLKHLCSHPKLSTSHSFRSTKHV